jgi:hypothetical protein
MNDLEPGRERSDSVEPPEEEPESQGPNLVLLYSLIVLAILIAIGLAMLIVLPFHRRAERYRRVSEVRLVQPLAAAGERVGGSADLPILAPDTPLSL